MKASYLKAKEFDIERNDKNLPFIIRLNEKRVLRRNKVMVNKGQILLHAVRQSFFFMIEVTDRRPTSIFDRLNQQMKQPFEKK